MAMIWTEMPNPPQTREAKQALRTAYQNHVGKAKMAVPTLMAGPGHWLPSLFRPAPMQRFAAAVYRLTVPKR
jgi:hypothetical protein